MNQITENSSTADAPSSLAGFQQQQRRFCAWLRNPSDASMPTDVSLARMQVYRDLIFHNLCQFIDVVFPIGKSMVNPTHWEKWQHEFVATHRCQSPLSLDISLHFREFMAEHTDSTLKQYPWLLELLQFEWLELYLDTFKHSDLHHSVAEEFVAVHPDSWQLQQPIWVLVYHYPVYTWLQSSPVNTNQLEPKPSAVAVWRDHHHDMQLRLLSPIEAMCLEQLQDRPLSKAQLIAHCRSHVAELSETSADELIATLLHKLGDWQLLSNTTQLGGEPHDKH